MNKFKGIIGYFSRTELVLWCASVVVIVVSFFSFRSDNYLSLIASLIGVTSLILNAKGNPIGQVLTIIFSVLYGVISYSFRYYGEMITYLCMTAPMAIIALISWLKNPYNGNKSEVRVNHISNFELVFMALLSLAVTAVFYFILKAFNTSSLILSTISITTSFAAAYLTFRRSPLYAIAYAANDIVLIALWIIASVYDISYVSVVVCFLIFLVNDIYGFINWNRIRNRQKD